MDVNISVTLKQRLTLLMQSASNTLKTPCAVVKFELSLLVVLSKFLLPLLFVVLAIAAKTKHQKKQLQQEPSHFFTICYIQ